jgi:hypothetical protein
MSPPTRKEAGILVLLDMVEFTSQARAHGDAKTAELVYSFEQELRRRADPRGFEFIKPIGDAALLFGTDPEGLIELMLDLFTRDRIPPLHDFAIKLRMIGHHGFFRFVLDEAGHRIDVHGSEAIKEFRIEKLAETWRLVITDALFPGV